MKTLISILFILLFSDNYLVRIYGSYETIYDKEVKNRIDRDCLLNFDNKSYVKKIGNGSIAKGKFKILEKDGKRILLVLNDKILTSKKSDQNIEFETLGSSIFEISEKNQDTLLFKETYSENPQKIVSSGIFVKSK